MTITAATTTTTMTTTTKFTTTSPPAAAAAAAAATTSATATTSIFSFENILQEQTLLSYLCIYIYNSLNTTTVTTPLHIVAATALLCKF